MAGIYLHIPFCRQACTYCNFHFSTSLKQKDDVIQAMILELELQKDFLGGVAVETVYFGGGTPSLLSADEINRFFDKIVTLFPVQSLKEFTLEANPDDLTIPYLKALRHTPVDRFSIGVQSFKESDLRYMNRAHTATQAEYAIKAAQDAGFTNITIDLIYGTPGLTDADWKYNLKQVKDLQLPHFSSYALTVEENTALHHHIKQKKTPPVDTAQAAGQLEILMDESAAMGFEHYEVSNFALPGMYAVHNTNYWRGLPYLGIGPSAHSFDGRHARSWNVANNARYVHSLLKDRKRPFEEENLTPAEHLNEYIMTSLRTMWGCDLAKIGQQWGSEARKTVEKQSLEHQERHWIDIRDEKIFLTNAGKLFADRIASDLFITENEYNYLG